MSIEFIGFIPHDDQIRQAELAGRLFLSKRRLAAGKSRMSSSLSAMMRFACLSSMERRRFSRLDL